MTTTPQNPLTPDCMPQLQEWANTILFPGNPLNPASLSKFGLQTPAHVIAFLKSDQGEKALNDAMAEAYKEKEAILEAQKEGREQQEMAQNRVKGIILLSVLAGEARAEKTQQLIEEQQNKQLHQNNAKSTSTSSVPLKTVSAADTINSNLVAHLDAQLEANSVLKEHLTEQEKALVEKFAEHNQVFMHFENSIGDLISEDQITQHMKQLEVRMDQLALEICECLEDQETNREGEARAKMLQHNHLVLQHGYLQDMKEVLYPEEGKPAKGYFNAEGEPCTSFKEAHFVLLQGQQIIKIEGNYYLLEKGQSPDSIKEPGEARNQAQGNYERNKATIMQVKVLVAHNQGLEHQDHQGRLQAVNDNEVMLKAARANAQQVVDASAAKATPVLSPMAVNTPVPVPMPTPKFTPDEIKQVASVRERCLEKPPQTQGDLRDLANSATPNVRQCMSQLLNIVTRDFETRINPASPIPGTTMATFLRNMAYIAGLDPNSPKIIA
ncbi:MAG: hypothetical protein ACHP6H_03000, partial [Legionellales bacterium]